MRNQIIDGVEYAVNLKGELYEVMIPGTKCPVSAGVLEQWYWDKGLNFCEVAEKLFCDPFNVQVSDSSIANWLSKVGIHKKSPSLARKHKFLRCPEDFRMGKKKRYEAILLSEKHREAARKNLAKATLKKLKILKNNQVFRFCEFCGKRFRTLPSRIKIGKGRFCSTSCASKFTASARGRKRAENNAVLGLYCPSCGGNIVTRSRLRGFLNFICLACRAGTCRPNIELGMRQDLEAAGALDDGRILASAFQKEPAS